MEKTVREIKCLCQAVLHNTTAYLQISLISLRKVRTSCALRWYLGMSPHGITKEQNSEMLPAPGQCSTADPALLPTGRKANKRESYYIIVMWLLGLSQSRQKFCSQMPYCVHRSHCNSLHCCTHERLYLMHQWKSRWLSSLFIFHTDLISRRIRPRKVDVHSPCPRSCNLRVWVREGLCVFVVPCRGEKQVAWRLKYWWMMINSCGWWKIEAHSNNRRCVLW